MRELKRAILQTLAYADVFNFPLTADEIRKWLIKGNNVTMEQCNNALSKLEISRKDNFYFLNGRDKIVDLRKKREKWSLEKLKLAEEAANLLRLIPFIKMVGLTGSLSLFNADKNDDIDLLIVSEKRRLWLTRFLATVLVELTGRRRRPADNHYKNNIFYKDKICLNMFLDEEHLSVPKKERDLFSVHEVVQMKPLWNRDGIYEKFIKENQWVREYLPNAMKGNNSSIAQCHSDKRNLLIFICNFAFCILNFKFIEIFVKKFQLWYMKKRRTTEVISDGIIRFHPKDARVWVLEEYNLRLKNLTP